MNYCSGKIFNSYFNKITCALKIGYSSLFVLYKIYTYSNLFSIVSQPSTICSPSSTLKLIKVHNSMDCDMRSKCRCSCVLQFTR